MSVWPLRQQKTIHYITLWDTSIGINLFFCAGFSSKTAFSVEKFHLMLVLGYGIVSNFEFSREQSERKEVNLSFVEVNRNGRSESIS